MIRSMTGFGRGEFSDGKRNVTAEIRSVNHRYNDISVRIPKRYNFAEDDIRKTVKKYVRRGKIEISVIVENSSSEDINIVLDTELAQHYSKKLQILADILDYDKTVSLEYIASLPDVIKTVPDVENEEAVIQAIFAAVDEASKSLDSMRCVEGKKLAEDILQRATTIDKLAYEIEERSPSVVKENTEKLRKRIAELAGDSISGSEERILLEAAVFADKINVTEETVRLHSHIAQLISIIKAGTDSEGKKLDFIAQEMNREANTIGSKANDIEITDKVLIMKSEIEKIREQVQNIE